MNDKSVIRKIADEAYRLYRDYPYISYVEAINRAKEMLYERTR